MAIQHDAKCHALFVGFLGRPPSATELSYWSGQLAANSNGPFSSGLVAHLQAQSSFVTDLTKSTEQLVTDLFVRLTGQSPSMALWSHFVTGVSSGLYDRESLPVAILRDCGIMPKSDGAGGLTYGAPDNAPADKSAVSIVTASGTDFQSGVENKVSYSTAFTTALDTPAENTAYVESSSAAEAALDAVTGDDATLTSAVAAVDSTVSATVTAGQTTTGQSYTLTNGADSIGGTSYDDSISGGLGSLSTVDEIHGGAGTDTMTITFAPEFATAGAGTAAVPTISGVEILNVTTRSNSAQLDFTDIRGVTALNVNGNFSLKLANIGNTLTAVSVNGLTGTLTIDQQTATASTAAYGVTLNVSAGTAMGLIWADDSGSTALVDTLTLNAQGDWNPGSGSNFSGVEKLVLQGNGNVSLGMASGVAGGMSADAFVDITANNTAAGIDASSLSGNLTLTVDVGDLNIKGGAGSDTFNMTAGLNTNDTLDGGAGTDAVNAVLTGGYFRPIISNVETFNFLVNSTAATADFRDVTGAATLNLLLGTGLLVDKAQTSLSTITVNSSDSTANALTVNYGSAAVASDVTLNLSNGAMSVLGQTAAATASGLGIGTVTMSGNTGSLTIITNSTAKYTAAALELKDFTAMTLNAASATLVVEGDVDLYTAQTLNLMAAAGKTLHISGNLSADSVRNFAVSAGQSATINVSGAANVDGSSAGTVTLVAGASAAIGFSAITFSGSDTITISVGASAMVSADSVTIGQEGATAGSGAVALNNLNISGAGDVSFAVFGTNTAVGGGGVGSHSSIALTINVGMESTAANVGISGLALSDVGSAATASEQDVTINVSGSGNFTLSAAATNSSNLTYHVNATGLVSGSNLVIDLSNVNDTGSTVSAVFGAHSGSFIGTDGADNIEFGLGAMTVDGGAGNDSITLGNTAVNAVRFSAAASGNIAGIDTIVGAGAGDVIIFAGGGTATASYSGGNAPSTGTATTGADFRTTSFSAQATADSTALDQIAIYTSNGDTVIQLLTQATATGATIVSAVDYVQVVLSNKDFTAITAAFKLDITGSGLSVTLL